MSPRTHQIARQAQIMGMEVAKEGREYRVFQGQAEVFKAKRLIDVQAFFLDTALAA